MRIVRAAFIVAVSLLLLDVTWFLMRPAVQINQSIEYTVQTGSSIRTVAKDLASYGLSRPYYLLAIAYLFDQQAHIQAGHYEIQSGTKPWSLVRKLTQGDIATYRFTLVAGKYLDQVLQALHQSSHMMKQIDSVESSIDIDGQQVPLISLEGSLFPDTYYYHHGDTDVDIITKAYLRMQQILGPLWQFRQADLPFEDQQQALILASIVEKETGLDADRAIIADVFIKRLKNNMKLQADPTVLYAIKNRTAPARTLSRHDLKHRSPYNTYLHRGLPPGPICMPGLASIKATLQPAKTPYWYFVAYEDGRHLFSETLEQHINNIQRAKKSLG